MKMVRMSKGAAEQLVKIIELHGSSILPNKDLLLLMKEVSRVFFNNDTGDSPDATKEKVDSVRLQESPPPRGGLVRKVKRGESHFT